MTTIAAATASIRDKVSDEEWQVRVDLACAYRLIAHFGWDDLIFTHLSARVPGPDHHFLINPYDLMFEEITASSLVKIDVSGRPVMPTSHRVNPAGFTIHSAIHMAREDAACVIHLHTPDGQAVAAMRDGLLPLTQTALNVIWDLAYHDYEGIALDLDERARIVADLGARNLMILRNHGTMAVGGTVADAFLRIYFLERACQAQVRALGAGRDGLLLAPPDAVVKVEAQNASIATFVSRQLTWPAAMRKADRLDRTYRS
jgi:ribulose-5-phosphate 4-epimerase/fuculose-1-phosphate aldolase